MEKQTKNIITREWVEKELRFYNTADIKSSLVLCGSFSLLLIPLTILNICLIHAVFDNVVIKILFSVLTGAVIGAPVWAYLFVLHTALADRKLLQRGEFDIVAREVQYKSEEMIRRSIVEYLHFLDFNKISVGHTTFQLASEGDTFYIVHYKAKKDIKLLYSAKMYEYQ